SFVVGRDDNVGKVGLVSLVVSLRMAAGFVVLPREREARETRLDSETSKEKMLQSFVHRNGVAKAERLLVTFSCILLLSNTSLGYSVLTHEFIIDFLWKDQIRSVLLSKFPGTTPDELKEAHAYAYGGSVIQDLGYYPFGHEYFSDLTHYVRTGDFVA